MQTEAERLDRVSRIAAKDRKRNRDNGVPDMDLEYDHEPCEWFAQLGFFTVLKMIGGPSEPNHDWSEEGGDDADHDKYVEARRHDHQRVADWLRFADVTPLPNRNGAAFGGLRLMWPDRVPALKVWAGQQTLAKLLQQRQKALPKTINDMLLAEAAISGSSGLDKRAATTALEDGFSVDAVGMLRMTCVGLELLAAIGINTVPLTVYPDGRIGYEAGDHQWIFSIEDRNAYYGRWGTAQRVRD